MKTAMTTKELKAISDSFIESRDLSRLGSFGSGAELVLIGDFIQRCLMLARTDIYVLHAPITEYINKLNILIREADTTLEDVYSEVFYWWRNSGDDALVDYSMESLNPYVNARINILSLALDHPERHDYLAVGITDTVAIAHFIADDIDPELALSTIAGVR